MAVVAIATLLTLSVLGTGVLLAVAHPAAAPPGSYFPPASHPVRSDLDRDPFVRVHPAGGSASVGVLPSHGYVSTLTNFSGGGFSANSNLSLTFGSSVLPTCSVGGNVTNSTGNFSCVFSVPVTASGAFTLGATDGVNSATTTFTVDPPTLAIAPGSGDAGDFVNVTGVGYAPTSSITVTFATSTVGSCRFGSLTSNSTGAISCGFRVPTTAAGSVTVGASDGTNSATTNFTVLGPTLHAAPGSAQVGTDVSVTGIGYALSAALTIHLGPAAVSSCVAGSLTANSSGGLSCKFVVPLVSAGVVALNASDGTNNATAAFTVLAPTILLTPSSGYIGTSASVTGAGFDPLGALTFTFGSSSISACTNGALTANASGGIDCDYVVPTLASGTYSVNLSDGINRASSPFVLGPPTLSLSPTSGFVGTEITATGAGYTPSTLLTVGFGSQSVSGCTTGSLRSDTHGDFSCEFDAPHAQVGSHLVSVSDGTNTATAPFSILSELVLSPTNGTVGTTVSVTGSGFDLTSTYSVDWNTSVSVCAGTTDAYGGFTCSFVVPSAPGGAHLLTAQEASNQATADFVVLPSLSLSPTAGAVGRVVSVTAEGLDALAAFSATWDTGAVVCSGTTDSNGAALCSFDVPASPQGVHTVTVVEGGYAPAASFQVSPSIALVPAGGAVATPVSLTGTGLEANTTYTACFLDNVSACSSGTSIDTLSNGSTQPGPNLVVPVLAPGPYFVDLSEAGSFVASAPFAVTSATLTILPTSGAVGTVVNVTGSAFDSNTQYVYCFQSVVSPCTGSTVFTSDGSGNIPAGLSLTVPQVPGGTYYVDVSRAGLLVALATFTLNPSASVLPGFGTVMSSADASADGLDASATVSVTWNATTTVCTGTTTVEGTLSCPFTVPTAAAGVHNLTFHEGGYAPTATFRVVAELNLNVSAGVVGSIVSAAGSGFDGGSPYVLHWNATVSLCASSTNVNGGFTCQFRVPSAAEGPANVQANSSTQTSSVVFVVLPTATLSAGNGSVGASVGVTGLGLPASTAYAVDWNATTTVCTGSTDSMGSLTCSFPAPPAPAGVHPFSLDVGSTDLALAYTVLPAFSASAVIGFVGSPLNATGTGFDAAAPYSVSWANSTTLCSGTTDANGGFLCDAPVPLAPGGMHYLTATERTRSIVVSFIIAPHVAVTPATAPYASTVTMNATGFAALHAVTVTWNSTAPLCANSTTSSVGALACSFTVPTTVPGTYWVNVTQGTQRSGALVRVNATTPTPSVNSGTPFPWWIVAVVVAGVAAVLVALILVGRRRTSRRPTPHPDVTAEPVAAAPLGPSAPSAASPWVEPATPPPALVVPASAPPPPAPAAPVAAAPAPPATPSSPSDAPDIDALILQLDKIAAEILKRPPPDEGEDAEKDEAGGSDSSSE